MRTILVLSVCAAIHSGCFSSARCPVAQEPPARELVVENAVPLRAAPVSEPQRVGKNEQPPQRKQTARGRAPHERRRKRQAGRARPEPWIPEPIPGLELGVERRPPAPPLPWR